MTAAELKTVASLGKKKFRDETGLFVVEGEKMVSEALDSGFEVVSVFRIEDVGVFCEVCHSIQNTSGLVRWYKPLPYLYQDYVM